ncbi:hypothetical protein PENTCL1PPCAC_21177, partial [Pristionchus entomophagus]
IIAFAVILHSSIALIEFSNSQLFDETDFEKETVTIDDLYNLGCRIYVSVPEASADIARQIIVDDYVHDKTSLFEISTMKNDDEKGYFDVDVGKNNQVVITNLNPSYATAPIAVWVVRTDIDFIEFCTVYEAANLSLAPESLKIVTVMSAEPFTLRSNTNGLIGLPLSPISMSYVIGNFIKTQYKETCRDDQAPSDIQAIVQSPLITLYFDSDDYPDALSSVSTHVGIENALDFSGISFAASPGYIGCEGQKTYRSSLYKATTSYTYSSVKSSYDLAISTLLNTDEHHPVSVTDYTNTNDYSLFGTTSEKASDGLTLHQTTNLEISWTRNETDRNQSFLVRLIPLNKHFRTTIG